jgi:chloride channel protein, CIC family
MQLHLDELIETDFVPLNSTAKFHDIIEAFTTSKRNVFPVVDKENDFIGIIDLDNIKEIMFKPEVYDLLTIYDVTTVGIMTIDKMENVASAMKKFESSGLWNIPVTDGNKYIGFISKSNLLSYYRRILKRSVSLL